MCRAHGNCVVEQLLKIPDAFFFLLESVVSNRRVISALDYLELPYVTFLCFVFRFDEAALSIQKEKNIYKEIENYPTCYKVYF